MGFVKDLLRVIPAMINYLGWWWLAPLLVGCLIAVGLFWFHHAIIAVAAIVVGLVVTLLPFRHPEDLFR